MQTQILLVPKSVLSTVTRCPSIRSDLEEVPITPCVCPQTKVISWTLPDEATQLDNIHEVLRNFLKKGMIST